MAAGAMARRRYYAIAAITPIRYYERWLAGYDMMPYAIRLRHMPRCHILHSIVEVAMKRRIRDIDAITHYAAAKRLAYYVNYDSHIVYAIEGKVHYNTDYFRYVATTSSLPSQ